MSDGRDRYTPEQTARGILKTFERGDYSIAGARLRDLSTTKRQDVLTIVRVAMTHEQWGVFRRYIRDLI